MTARTHNEQALLKPLVLAGAVALLVLLLVAGETEATRDIKLDRLGTTWY